MLESAQSSILYLSYPIFLSRVENTITMRITKKEGAYKEKGAEVIVGPAGPPASMYNLSIDYGFKRSSHYEEKEVCTELHFKHFLSSGKSSTFGKGAKCKVCKPCLSPFLPGKKGWLGFVQESSCGWCGRPSQVAQKSKSWEMAQKTDYEGPRGDFRERFEEEEALDPQACQQIWANA